MNAEERARAHERVRSLQESSHVHCARSWRVIAAEVTTESDPGKLLKLIQELTRALAQERVAGPERRSEEKVSA